MSELTIIIPAFNEEEGIANTINNLLPFANRNNWCIMIINDGSSDKTREIAERIEGITVINHPYNKGYGASLKTGIKNAQTELIAMYDADGQHKPEDLEMLYNNLGNYDMIVGKRGKDSHQDWVRKPGKFVLSLVANFLSGIKIPDLNSGLRIIKKNIIENVLHLMPNGFSFSTTSTIAFFNLGFNVGYFPIITNKRVGKSSVKQLKHGSNIILLIIRLIVLFNPLKVFLPMSSFLVFGGIVWEIIFGIILGERIKLNPTAFLMLITGVLIFFFGLVVDQVSEMRKHQYLK